MERARWLAICISLGAFLIGCVRSTSDFKQSMSPCSFPTLKGSYDDLRLTAILGQQVQIVDGAYTYTVGICADLGKNDSAGVLQHKNGSSDVVIGRYNDTTVMSGSHWIQLTYHSGDTYNNACNKTGRMATIMFVCNHNEGEFKNAVVVEENANMTEDCYYLFEVEHCLACEEGCDSYYNKLSPGSIILIGFFSLAGAYLLIGFVYQRCVVRARGWQQVPNVYFWREIGLLQSEGCSLVCRCDSGLGGNSGEEEYEAPSGSDTHHHSSDSPYRGGTSLLEEHDDDRLLPA